MLTLKSLTATEIFMRNFKDALSVTEFDREQFLRQQIIPVERLNALERGVQKNDLTLEEAKKIFYALQSILHWEANITFEKFFTVVLTQEYLQVWSVPDLQ